jgi:hypothetical protein
VISKLENGQSEFKRGDTRVTVYQAAVTYIEEASEQTVMSASA